MPTPQATPQDADVIIKLYELRREPVMRESRDAMNQTFWPKSYEEAAAVMDLSHPLNRAFRQVSSYWEMVYNFARHGAVNFDLLVETNGEGLFFFSRFEPYISQLREKNSPTMFSNTTWLIENSDFAASRMEMFRKRIKEMMSKK